MRLLTTLTFLLISSLSYGQGIWNQVNGNSKFWRLKADSVIIVPRDTSATNNAFYLGAPVGDSGRLAHFHGRFWGRDNTKFRSFAFSDEIPISLDSFYRANDTIFIRSGNDTIAVKDNYPGMIWPRVGNLYGFGDSQTAGGNSAGAPYSNGTTLYPQYRWLNLLSVMNSRNLAVNNYALGSTRISWALDFTFIQSQFNRTGNLDRDWRGVAVAMNGWNNLSGETIDNEDFYRVKRHADEAFIAKLLIDDYAGISLKGWGSDYATNPVDNKFGWNTTGVGDSLIGLTMGVRNFFPFYFGDPLYDKRPRTKLESGDNASFTLTDKRAIAIFYETSTNGGDFTVHINSVKYADGNNDYTTTECFPGVIWIENVPATSTVTVTSTNGDLYLLAFGWVDKNSTILPNKTIIYGTTSGNNLNASDSILYRVAQGAERAAGTFSTYPVFFANPYNNWVPSDREPTDQPHITYLGNQHIANAYNSAVKVNGTSENIIIRSQYTPSLQEAATANPTITSPINIFSVGIQRPTTASGGASIVFYNGNGGATFARWIQGMAVIESGSNTGSNYVLQRLDDNANLLGTVINANRATGVVDFETTPTINAGGTNFWTTANDGPGSGLNADQLDGLDATAFAPASGSANYVHVSPGAAQTGAINMTGEIRGQRFFASSSVGNGGTVSLQSAGNSRFWIVANTTLKLGGLSDNSTNPPLAIRNTGQVGINDTVPTSILGIKGSISLPLTSVSTNTTLDATHHTVRVTAASTITFPTASSCAGRIYCVINYNTGGNITTSAYLSPLAVSTTTVANGATVWVQSDGTNWYQIK